MSLLVIHERIEIQEIEVAEETSNYSRDSLKV